MTTENDKLIVAQAAKLVETNKERGNNIDPLMGTCFGKMDAESVRNVVTTERFRPAIQDGADFYAVESSHLLARYEYPFLKAGDWYSLAAAQEAAAMFLRDNPSYKLDLMV
jgi:hypothetical protein